MTTQPAIIEPASMLPAALWWANNGINIFPLWWPENGACACPQGPNCSSPAKHPLTPTGFHNASSDPDIIKEWWTRWPHANIGAPTGDTFDVIDIDGGAPAWAELTAKHGTPKHIAVAITGRTTGGFHYYVTPGGQKTIPSGKRGLPPKIEIKGQGGYIVVPPSTHATGNTYQWIKTIDGTTNGDTDYPQWLAAVNATQPQPTPTPITPINTNTTSSDRTARYGAAVLTRATDLIRNAGEGARWNTLALEAIPLAARAIAGGCLNRQETITAIQQAAQTAGLDPNEINRIPHLFDHIERQGITHPIKPADTETNLNDWLRTLPKADIPNAYLKEADNHNNNDDEPTHTTWWPRDLTAILAGKDPEPEPTYLTRQDGKHLFYPAKINGLIGESESGKTWIALHAVTQTLNNGQTCLYLDFEDTAPGIISRLKLLGTTNQQLQNLIYIGPDENLHEQATHDLGQTLATHCPDLIILDGFNAAMTMLGLDLNSNTDATKFSQDLLKPLARTGACVAYVDHVPKNKDNRGKGGIGAQAKRAMTTGAAITVEILEPFGRGMTGRLQLTVDKDRPGHVRAASLNAKNAGTAILTSTGDHMTIHIEPADTPLTAQELDALKNDQLQNAIYQWLADKPYPQSKQSIQNGVRAKGENVRRAVEHLVALHLIQEIPSGRYPKYVANKTDKWDEMEYEND